MSQTVFVLGAGASCAAGAPLMDEFIDKARDLRERAVADQDGSFDLVFRGIAELTAAHSKAQLNLLNLESVLSAFEMAKLIGRLGSMPSEEVERLPSAMTRVIARTIGATIAFPIQQDGRLAGIPEYQGFAHLVRDLGTRSHGGGPRAVAILTFNYDPCLDAALYAAGVNCSYRLDNNTESESVSLLKLHGSLNWVKCDKCGAITTWDVSKRLSEVRLHRDEVEDFVGQGFALTSILEGTCQCPHDGHVLQRDKPVIVPPTYSKGALHGELSQIWQAAGEELAKAERIYIMGFSLPETDQFFRQFYAVGTIGEAILRRFWVFDPDETAGDRFKALLGPGAQQRFKYHQMKFREATEFLRKDIQSDKG